MIIGLGGRISSGKTAVADYLVEKFNLPKIAFAKGLKDLVTACTGLTDDDKPNKQPFDGNFNFAVINAMIRKYEYEPLTQAETDTLTAIEYHPKGKAYRLYLQFVGTEIFRSRNNNHWIEVLAENVANFKDGFICDDVRFPNEHNAIKHRFKDDFNVTIKVVNPNDCPTDTHASEVMIDRIQFDSVITNAYDSSMKDDPESIGKLHRQIDELFNNVRLI